MYRGRMAACTLSGVGRGVHVMMMQLHKTMLWAGLLEESSACADTFRLATAEHASSSAKAVGETCHMEAQRGVQCICA